MNEYDVRRFPLTMGPDAGYGSHDEQLVEETVRLLRATLRRPFITPRQIIGVGRALVALERLPETTPGVFVVVTLATSRTEWCGPVWYTVQISEDTFEISVGGSEGSGAGHDTYTSLEFHAETGGYRDGDPNPWTWAEHVDVAIQQAAELSVEDDSDPAALDGFLDLAD